MSRFVLDCSVTVAWCIEDEANPSTDRLLDSLNLSVYDAAYLELSIREALPLATRDRILAGAAKRCGVPLK